MKWEKDNYPEPPQRKKKRKRKQLQEIIFQLTFSGLETVCTYPLRGVKMSYAF